MVLLSKTLLNHTCLGIAEWLSYLSI